MTIMRGGVSPDPVMGDDPFVKLPKFLVISTRLGKTKNL